jgi:poly-gamma-glutamate capsule biosynthesis protein CapA/YwtB (metallophosphatase superfamily)
MNLANNHALDHGPGGPRQTITALDRVHIRRAGLPGSITKVTVKGARVTIIGFAPYTWATSLSDIPAARTLVTQAAHASDMVIVLMHAGAEGSDKVHTPDGPEVQLGENRGYVRGFAHAVIDGGADLVLGSGPMSFADWKSIAAA